MPPESTPKPPSVDWFVAARYGLFVHWGLYSLLGRGEWVRNREGIPRRDYAALARRFRGERFNAEALCDLARAAGQRYVVFTTMHHDGFRLYHTELSSFCSTKTAAGRDFVAEVVAAARARGLRVGLYHSLNSWHDAPDAVAALERPRTRARFIDRTLARVEELVRRFPDVDLLWYDGWWPFDATGWRATEMNARIRAIAPHLLCNGRNGLPGDFATPEGHLSSPRPWRPWEGCLSLNESWGWHAGDRDWKSPAQVAGLLQRCAAGRGNLLLNVGPRGDGSLPAPAVRTLRAVGRWLTRCGEAIFETDAFTWDLQVQGDHRSDWSHHGPFTARGRHLYWHVSRWPGSELVLNGLETRVQEVLLLGSDRRLEFQQRGRRLVIRGAPEAAPDPVCPVLRLTCTRPPRLYLTAGMRVPRVPHPHYDPCPSDLPPP